MLQPSYDLLESGGYVLTLDFSQQVGITGQRIFLNRENIRLLPSGRLITYAGFRWNGDNLVSDHPRSVVASLGHDALYRLIHCGWLDKKYRKQADTYYRKKLVECGFSRWKAWLRWAALRAVWTIKDLK